MKTWIALVALAATALGAAVPAPQTDSSEIFRRAVTPDGTCGIVESGAGKGYTCPTASYRCCSKFGWCGDAAEHCGSGCQSAYGACSGTSTPPTNPNPPVGNRPHVGNIPYGSFVYTCNRPGFVALTFDDGPHIYTNALLDILKANGVVATFFINGHNWGNPITGDSAKAAAIKRMIKDGHQIGSHTWDHADMNTLSVSQITSEMTQLESALINIIGKYPTYMRPPYFSCGQTCLNTMYTLGYHVINTDLDTLDWQNNTPSTIHNSKNIFASAINSANPATRGFIPLTHDVHDTTVNSLVQSMIDTLVVRGFRATTVGWCLDDHSSGWYRTKQ